MKVTIESMFHSGMAETFIGLNAGYNYRWAKKQCASDCRCGWPTGHVSVHAPNGWTAVVSRTCNDTRRIEILMLPKKGSWK